VRSACRALTIRSDWQTAFTALAVIAGFVTTAQQSCRKWAVKVGTGDHDAQCFNLANAMLVRRAFCLLQDASGTSCSKMPDSHLDPRQQPRFTDLV
jgi:hypothetical protein